MGELELCADKELRKFLCLLSFSVLLSFLWITHEAYWLLDGGWTRVRRKIFDFFPALGPHQEAMNLYVMNNLQLKVDVETANLKRF